MAAILWVVFAVAGVKLGALFTPTTSRTIKCYNPKYMFSITKCVQNINKLKLQDLVSCNAIWIARVKSLIVSL